MLLSYSGGAQVATGAVDELHTQLRSPLLLITLGGFHNGANDLTDAERVHGSASASDGIERFGTWIFLSAGGCAVVADGTDRRAGKITVHRLDPATHLGPRSYISPTPQPPDGRSYLDRTTDTVIALIRARHSATAATTQPSP